MKTKNKTKMILLVSTLLLLNLSFANPIIDIITKYSKENPQACLSLSNGKQEDNIFYIQSEWQSLSSVNDFFNNYAHNQLVSIAKGIAKGHPKVNISGLTIRDKAQKDYDSRKVKVYNTLNMETHAFTIHIEFVDKEFPESKKI